jgi:hypothetical protein
MKRCGLLLAALLTLVLTGLVLQRAGLLSRPALEARANATPAEVPLPAFYRQCQPTHWREVALAR